MNPQHKEAALTLVKDLSPKQVFAVLHAAENINQHEIEHAKSHALQSVEMPPESVAAFCQHMLDGGGVIDPECQIDGERSLFDHWMQGLHDQDWLTIRHLMPHVIKSWMKVRNQVRVFPGGGKQLRGAPTGAIPHHIPPAAAAEETKAAE